MQRSWKIRRGITYSEMKEILVSMFDQVDEVGLAKLNRVYSLVERLQAIDYALLMEVRNGVSKEDVEARQRAGLPEGPEGKEEERASGKYERRNPPLNRSH